MINDDVILLLILLLKRLLRLGFKLMNTKCVHMMTIKANMLHIIYVKSLDDEERNKIILSSVVVAMDVRAAARNT